MHSRTLLLFGVLVACSPAKRPVAATAPLARPAVDARPTSVEMPIPKVVRRLLAEERELVRGTQTMAHELGDPSGRARATAEADALAAELATVAGPIDAAFREERNVDSPTLDRAIDGLMLLDTRVTLLHERLRAATERTQALEVTP